MKYNLRPGDPEKSRTPCIVTGVFEGGILSPTAKKLDKASGGYINKVIKRGDLKGGKNESLLLHDIKGISATRILLVGLGSKSAFKESEFSEAIEFFVRKLRAMRLRSALVCIIEVAKFKKEEIEFLFELVKNSMIPGKHLGIAMDVVNKLKQQYQLLDRKTAKVQKVESAKSVNKKEISKVQEIEKQRLKEEDGELWVEE